MTMIDGNPIAAWRCYGQRYRLEGCRCQTCKKIYFPKIFICSCGDRNFEPFFLQGDGILVSFTKIVNPPYAFKKMASYCLGLVQLDEGPTIVAQLADVAFEKLYIGMRMSKVFRRCLAREHGVIHYGIKFIPKES